MRRLNHVFLLCLLSLVRPAFADKGANPFVFDNMDVDSLINVIQTSNDKRDFERADSLIVLQAGEFNSEPNRTIILICTERTRQLKFEYLYARFIFRESIINTVRGNYARATRLAKECMLIFSKINAYDVSGCYNTIGGMVATNGNIEQGIKYLEKAIEINEKFKNREGYASGYCDHQLVLGYIYLLDDQYDQAKIHLDSSYAKAVENDYWVSQTYNLLNFGKIHLKRGEYEDALDDLYTGLKLSREKKIKSLEAVTQSRIAEVFLEMGELDNALMHYLIAEDFAMREKLERRLLVIYEQIKDTYFRKNNLEKAYEYQEKYIELLKKVNDQEKKEELQMLEVKFSVNEKNAKINALALEKDHEQEQKQLLQVAIIITIAAFILLVFTIILIYNRIRLNRKIQTERQEKELSLYQMMALKSQMNPHFIFNALNSIQDLILKEKTEESYTYISKFAELVRETLNHSNEEFIDIEEELKSIELYLQLEKLRFQDGLEVDFVTNGIENITIPPLLIQPFIENAIKHGLLHKKGDKHLRIHFKLKESLICTISDNGVGRAASEKIQARRKKSHASFATKSIENRFELLRKSYGENLGITYIDTETDGKPTGTTVILTVPFKQKF